jgi:hypothetical protein
MKLGAGGRLLCLGKGDQTSSFKNTTEFGFTKLRKIGNSETRLGYWVHTNTKNKKKVGANSRALVLSYEPSGLNLKHKFKPDGSYDKTKARLFGSK